MGEGASGSLAGVMLNRVLSQSAGVVARLLGRRPLADACLPLQIAATFHHLLQTQAAHMFGYQHTQRHGCWRHKNVVECVDCACRYCLRTFYITSAPFERLDR